MIKYLLLFDSEVIIFLVVETLIIIAFLIFHRYSRNHGGVFDRRIAERRFCIRRENWHISGRRMGDIVFSKVNAGRNAIFGADTDRRVCERRMLVDRREV